MDPNTTLHNAREAGSEILAEEAPVAESDEMKIARLERIEEAAIRLAESFDALDGWMTKKGSTPHAWTEGRDHR